VARGLVLIAAAIALVGGVPAGATPTVVGRSSGTAFASGYWEPSDCYYGFALTGSISFGSRTFQGTARASVDFNCWEDPEPPLELTGTSPDGDLYAVCIDKVYLYPDQATAGTLNCTGHIGDGPTKLTRIAVALPDVEYGLHGQSYSYSGYFAG
jgi:hypothetical protein